MPKTRRTFWENKLNANVARDRRNQRKLQRMGWRVIVVWECEVEKKPGRVMKKAGRLRRTTSNTSAGGGSAFGGQRSTCNIQGKKKKFS